MSDSPNAVAQADFKELPACLSCRFFKQCERYRGDCHRFPPNPAIGGWPKVAMSDWCGEFQPKDP